jgi:MFS family permease
VNRYTPLLRNTGFRTVWSAAVVSGLGDRIAAIALYLLIYRLTGNPVDLGLLAATQIVPAIVLGPVAGLACDRMSRRGIMIGSDLLGALVVASIPLVTAPLHVYLLATLLGCGRQFSGPARMALLPDVVGEEHLAGANSLLMLTGNLIMLVGWAGGGMLVAWRGTDPAFWLDAVTFVASAGILTLWRFEEPARAATPAPQAAVLAEGATEAGPAVVAPSEPGATGGLAGRIRGLWSDAAAGLVAVAANPGQRVAFGFFAVLTFVTAIQQPLVVIFVKDILQGSDSQLGLIFAASGLGGMLGAVGGGFVVSRHQPLRVIATMTAIDGVLLMIFAYNRSIALAMILFACFGALATLALIALATYLQESAARDQRGRTFGWLGTVVGPWRLAAVFLGPLLAEVLGVVMVLAICAVAEVGMAVLGARARIPAARPDDGHS